MRPIAHYRPSHFIAPLLLLPAGLGAGSLMAMSEFFVSLFNVLPTLLLLLGGALCLIYGRQRQLFMLAVVYIGYFLLDTQVGYYRAHQAPRADAPLVFHLICLLLPLLYGLYGIWEERTHLLQDLFARGAVLVAVAAVATGLARSFPQGLLGLVSETYWPALSARWMVLAQLPYLGFLIAFGLLLSTYLRQPRPLHAAQLIGLFGLLWMLPKVFILPYALHVMSSLVMLNLAAAVAHEAYQMAFRDELTGLPGRRALNERCQRLGQQYVLAMVDVDHFKKCNDTHGHDVGDQVLRMVASHLKRTGGGGKAYRYGGEEFTLVFAGKPLEDCLPHLEAVREVIEGYAMQLRDRGKRPKDDRKGREQRGASARQSISVTVSIGVAERDAVQRHPEEVIKAADQALYSAKSGGRNRVAVHGQARRGAVRTA
ncbi:GGDEF domain-containing protein [Pseudomonas panipatensis]|uniref:diguanylate cyclase n=1 Tax=Pseudomonas panipatensis TaxID=428992 RepID=A0A1G8JCL1_9PSED|nr:GGDEF domain-containing protein [Pseudomonas panipatensis]SDI28832.1 diguanylate cyclase (GGDEF) domain-containing protein [Pseudomonas panipatensis]SMP50834.1 diguanylate cyclase (GGDEF) domain-containing protein [Pseudomonas panipatensis]